jgi:hypothetical protein
MQEGKRKKNLNLMVLIGAIIVLLLSGCSGSSGGGSGVGILNGTVNDLNSVAISNADVVVGPYSTKTLSNGTYSFTNLPSGTKIVKISAAGYTPAYRQVDLNAGSTVKADIAFLAALDSKTTPMTTAGGITTNTDGSVKMVFQSGSLSTAADVTLTSVPKIAAPYNAPSDQQFVSYIIYAKPDDIDINSSYPVTLYVPNQTAVTIEPVPFYRFNPDTFKWEYISTGRAETGTGKISCEGSGKMGWIAAIMPLNPLPGSIEGYVTNASSSAIQGANVWTNSSYAVTDQYGHYLLSNVPTGTSVEVHASALGYVTPANLFAAVTTQNTTHNVNFSNLIALTQRNITGTVKSTNGLNPIANARIAEYYGNQAYTDSYGRYTIYNVTTGATSVTAYATDHISSMELIASDFNSSVNNFLLQYQAGSGSDYKFNFVFGTMEGFTATGLWHVQAANATVTLNPRDCFNRVTTQTRKVMLPVNPDFSADEYLPAQHDGTAGYYMWFGSDVADTDTTREGSYIWEQIPTDTTTPDSFTGGKSRGVLHDDQGFDVYSNIGTLESPLLNLTGYSFGTLSFWTWWDIEGRNPASGYDRMEILIKRNNEANWTSLCYLNPYNDPDHTLAQSKEAYTTGGYFAPAIWVKHNIDISTYVGSYVQIQFKFDSVDAKDNGYRGWVLDDISVLNTKYNLAAFGNMLRKELPIIPRN